MRQAHCVWCDAQGWTYHTNGRGPCSRCGGVGRPWVCLPCAERRAQQAALERNPLYPLVRTLYTALSETTVRAHTGYDWNADPDNITRLQGDAFQAAREAGVL